MSTPTQALNYFWSHDPNGSNGLTTSNKGLLALPASNANPTQTVLNADWTADEAILAISAAPTNLTATIASGTENDLAWTNNAASPDSQTGLNIYRSTNDTTFSLLTSVGAPLPPPITILPSPAAPTGTKSNRSTPAATPSSTAPSRPPRDWPHPAA